MNTPSTLNSHSNIHFQLSSYSNSVVQALYFCKPFRHCVLNFPQANTTQIHTPLAVNPNSPMVSQNGHSYFPSTSSSTSSSPAPNGNRANGSSTPIKENPNFKSASRGSVNGNGASTPAIPIEKDQNNINLAPGMEDTLFSSLKDLFWKISTNKKKSGVIAPVNFINKVKKENGNDELYHICNSQKTWMTNTCFNRII